MNNAKIIEILTRLMILRQFESIRDNSIKKHQKAAYERVIQGIKSYPSNFSSPEDMMANLPGIGKNMERYIRQIFSIDDYIQTGIPDIDIFLTTNIPFFNRLVVMADLMQISGIGFKRAGDLYEQGYTSSEQIKVNSGGRNREYIASQYLTELQKRIPHDKITYFSSVLSYFLSGLEIYFTIAGSYRRHTETSKDVDTIFYGTNVVSSGKELVHRLIANKIVLETLSLGDDKFEGIAYLDDEYPAIRVDFLFLQDSREYPYALLYFTGSKNFNIKMKSIARDMGYTLGNLNMYRTDLNGNKEYVYVNTEEDIFTFLHMTYVAPENRNI